MDDATSGHHLLLVEDDDGARKSLAALLRLDGWTVSTAADGIDALTQLTADKSIDIIVTDYMMPRLNGLEVIERIRSNPEFPRASVVLVSAADLPQELRRQADAFLSKPLDAQAFKRTLLRLV